MDRFEKLVDIALGLMVIAMALGVAVMIVLGVVAATMALIGGA